MASSCGAWRRRMVHGVASCWGGFVLGGLRVGGAREGSAHRRRAPSSQAPAGYRGGPVSACARARMHAVRATQLTTAANKECSSCCRRRSSCCCCGSSNGGRSRGGGEEGGRGRCLDHGSVREKLLAVQLRLVRGHTRPGLPRTRPGIVGVSDLHLCRGFRVPGRHEAAMKPRRGVRGYDVSRDMRPGETRALCLCACLTSPPGKQQLGGLVTCRRSRRRRRTCPPPPTPWRPWGARCGRPGGRNVNSLSTVTQRHEAPPPLVLIGHAASLTPY